MRLVIQPTSASAATASTLPPGIAVPGGNPVFVDGRQPAPARSRSSSSSSSAGSAWDRHGGRKKGRCLTRPMVQRGTWPAPARIAVHVRAHRDQHRLGVVVVVGRSSLPDRSSVQRNTRNGPPKFSSRWVLTSSPRRHRAHRGGGRRGPPQVEYLVSL